MPLNPFLCELHSHIIYPSTTNALHLSPAAHALSSGRHIQLLNHVQSSFASSTHNHQKSALLSDLSNAPSPINFPCTAYIRLHTYIQALRLTASLRFACIFFFLRMWLMSGNSQFFNLFSARFLHTHTHTHTHERLLWILCDLRSSNRDREVCCTNPLSTSGDGTYEARLKLTYKYTYVYVCTYLCMLICIYI